MISGLVRSESPEPHDSRRTDEFNTPHIGRAGVWATRQPVVDAPRWTSRPERDHIGGNPSSGFPIGTPSQGFSRRHRKPCEPKGFSCVFSP
jgi:hypothetical protein